MSKTLLDIKKGDILYGLSLKYYDNERYCKSYCQELEVIKVCNKEKIFENSIMIEITAKIKNDTHSGSYLSYVIDETHPDLIVDNLDTCLNVYELSYDKNAIINRCEQNNIKIKEIINNNIEKLQEVLKEF